MNGNRPSYPMASTISLWWGGTHSYAELSPGFTFERLRAEVLCYFSWTSREWRERVMFLPTGEVMIGDYQIGMIREGKV